MDLLTSLFSAVSCIPVQSRLLFFFSISWKFESTIGRLCHFFHLYYARRNHWKYLYPVMRSLPIPLLSCSSSLHFSSLNYPSQNLLDWLYVKKPRTLTRVSQDLFIEPMLYFIIVTQYKQNFISRKWMNFSTLWKMSFPVSEGIVAMKLCFEWLYFIATFFINQDCKTLPLYINLHCTKPLKKMILTDDHAKKFIKKKKNIHKMNCILF